MGDLPWPGPAWILRSLNLTFGLVLRLYERSIHQIQRGVPLKRATHIALVASVLVVVATGGGLALGAGSTVTVQVKGQYAKRFRTVCGKVHKHFDFFHRRQTIKAEGVVTPPPGKAFKVRLEIKRCIHGVFVKIGDRSTTGQAATGDFKGLFSARPLAPRSTKPGAVVYDRVRAIVGTARSDYDYFAITN